MYILPIVTVSAMVGIVVSPRIWRSAYNWSESDIKQIMIKKTK